MWSGIKNSIKEFPSLTVEQLLRHIVPPGGTYADPGNDGVLRVFPGNPGAGVFHGRHNINKCLTYRATYVPGGFNVQRDARRAALAANAERLRQQQIEIDRMRILDDGVFI